MTELVGGEIGSVGSYDLEFKDGKLRLSLSVNSSGVEGGLFIDLAPEYFLDKLAAAIPGEIDDVIIDAIKKALK